MGTLSPFVLQLLKEEAVQKAVHAMLEKEPARESETVSVATSKDPSKTEQVTIRRLSA